MKFETMGQQPDQAIVDLEKRASEEKLKAEKHEELRKKLEAILQKAKEECIAAIGSTLDEDPTDEDSMASTLIKGNSGLENLGAEAISMLESNRDAEAHDAKRLEIEVDVRKRLGPDANSDDIQTLVDNEFQLWNENCVREKRGAYAETHQ
jgi:hypothetical protein